MHADIELPLLDPGCTNIYFDTIYQSDPELAGYIMSPDSTESWVPQDTEFTITCANYTASLSYTTITCNGDDEQASWDKVVPDCIG